MRPSLGDRPQFAGTVADYEWLARWFGYQANVTPVWKGPGTTLIVLSNAGMPLCQNAVNAFREVLKDFTPVNVIITAVSVG